MQKLEETANSRKHRHFYKLKKNRPDGKLWIEIGDVSGEEDVW
jgi:hypothetical protein